MLDVQEGDPDRADQERRLARWAAWAAIVAVPIAVVAIVVSIAINEDDNGPGPTGQIVSPGSGDSVARDITARGTLADIPDNGHVWLAVHDGNLLFPQDSEIPTANGKWMLQFHQGGKTPEIGLELLLMGDEGHKFIEDRFAKENFGGISKIPGAERLDFVENLHLE
jgi:hypothetical protein